MYRYLQPLDLLGLLGARLARHELPTNLCDQVVQLDKTAVHVVSLLAIIIRLDDQTIRLCSTVPRSTDSGPEDGRKKRQQRRQRKAKSSL